MNLLNAMLALLVKQILLQQQLRIQKANQLKEKSFDKEEKDYDMSKKSNDPEFFILFFGQ